MTLPDGITSWTADVSRSSELDAIFDEILPDGLDLMINNAGVAGPTKLVEDITDEEWRTTMAVCIDSHFFCARRVVPVFKAQQSGAIINLISGAGILGYPTRTPYVAAKWAVTGLTKTLAMELGPDNIRVNGVVPGNVNGDRMDRVDRRPCRGGGSRPRRGAADVRHRHVDAVLRRPRGDRRPHRVSLQRLRPPHLRPDRRCRRQHRNARTRGADGTTTDMLLTSEERAWLDGEAGAATQLAMRLLVAAGEATGAARLIPVEMAHINSCHYSGQLSLDFAEFLLANDARLAVPTHTNASLVSAASPDLRPVDPTPTEVRGARRLMEIYERLGCSAMWSCAPYQDARRATGLRCARHRVGVECGVVLQLGARRTNQQVRRLARCRRRDGGSRVP